MTEELQPEDALAPTDGTAEPELLCPSCANKDWRDEEEGKRCRTCFGILASGPRARAALAKSVEFGALEPPQGALSCAKCSDLLVPVDIEKRTFHACASCQLVWSPDGTAPTLPERKGRTLRFNDDRIELRPDGTAVVVAAKEMAEWEPKKRHSARIQIEDRSYVVARVVPQTEGRFRYELIPFDTSKTMIIGPAIIYDAWAVDARDGIQPDLPSPVRTARRVLLALVVFAPVVVAVLYFKPFGDPFASPPPPSPPLQVVKPVKKTRPVRKPNPPVPAPMLPRVVSPPRRMPPPTRPPPRRIPGVNPQGRLFTASMIHLKLRRKPGRPDSDLTGRLTIEGVERSATFAPNGNSEIPIGLARRLVPTKADLRVGEIVHLRVDFPGDTERKLDFSVVPMGKLVVGRAFMRSYTMNARKDLTVELTFGSP